MTDLPIEKYPTEAAWLEARKKSITSSDAAVIAGVGYTTPLELWMEKTGRLQPQPDSLRLRFGRFAEKIIDQELAAERGITLIEPPPHSLVRSTKNPNRTASLDRAVAEGGIAEFKTVISRLADRWKDGPADYAFVQVQHALYVTGSDRAFIACLMGAGEHFVSFEVTPVASLIDELMEREEAFERYVKTDTPPPALAADNKALATLYPKDSGETVILDAARFAHLATALRAAKAQAKEADEAIEAAEAMLKEAIGTATFGEIPGIARYSWKHQVREMKPQPARTIETRVFREVKL